MKTIKQITEAELTDGWFKEAGLSTESHSFEINKVIFEGETEYQDILIIDTTEFGKMLVIDGFSQSAQLDEYIYHEALVQPAMIMHPDPKRVLVLGGGEGATIREVLRHKTVEEVVMIDLDGELVNLCKEHMYEWHQGAFNDPRLKLFHMDAFAWLDQNKSLFDVVIVDLCDEEDGTSVEHLYSDEFYQLVKAHLAPDGIVVIQAMEILPYKADGHVAIRKDIQGMLKDVYSYYTFVPSFWSNWSFVIGGNNIDKSRMQPDRINKILAERGIAKDLRFYDGDTNARIFNLSKDIRVILES